ncbi:sensor histidine kinase [Rhodovibrio salinarum]|uniref:sensor histidine kinase n=1 Tax=Rhodovibrio salinarum TaxID=1087 RepID=UPI0006876BA3|nr:PAS domain S-box protein [Rhodovibrio salinarum]
MTATNFFGVIVVAVILAAGVLILGVSFLVATVAKLTRQRTEAREVQQRLSDVVELAADWVWETDSENRFVYFSERFEQVTGLSRDLFLGQNREFLFSRDGFVASEWTQHLKTIQARQPFFGFRYSYFSEDGRRYVFQINGKPVFSRKGRFIGYRGTGTDLTETVTARADAEATEAHARRVLDSALDAFFSLDPDGLIVDWNRAAEQTFNWSREEALGRSVAALIVPGGELDAHRRMMGQLRVGNAWFLNSRVRTTARRRDGSVFLCELAITETWTPHGRTFNAFMRDITDREARQKAMERARYEAEVASKSKSEFLAAMSHELRTPLNAVIGFSDLLFSCPDIPEEQRLEYLHDIRDSGNHLLELINDVLDLSKIEAGRTDLSEEPVNLAELARACTRLLGERAQSALLELREDVPEDLPAVMVDRTRIKQILINLLSNSVKFTEPGGTVTLAARLDDQGRMRLSVADTGVGMAPDQLSRAFEPFTQLDNVYSRRQQGTGLGLALVRMLTELHDGTLEVDTAPGVGTTATCVLPAERVIVDPGKHDAQRRMIG